MKAYTTKTISSNSQPVSSSDPAATGGQILRRVSSTLALGKAAYQSNEALTSRQIRDSRHGVKGVSGSIVGELSCLTYFDLIEAAMRGTRVSPISKSNTELTSVAADSGTSKFTFGGGDPLTEGFRVGHIYRFASLSESTNNAKNFLALAFGGASNREMTVYPAPTTMGADTTFTVTSTGKHVIIPASAHVVHKFAFERYYADLDLHELFTECRIGGFNLALPPTGLATIEFPIFGRDMESASGGSSPFFTAPAAETTTGLLAAVNGLLRIEGANVGVITGMSINFSNGLRLADPVVGQNFVPDVPWGRMVISGQISAYLESLTLLDLFKNETECEIIAYMTATSAINSPAMSFVLPKVKFGAASPNVQADGSVLVSMPYQAMESTVAGTTAPGMEATTLMVTDSEIV